MTKKMRIILLLISLSICLGLMSGTYSRYVANAKGDISASFSKWQILVSDVDITNNNTSTIPITPHIYEQDNVADNTVAPSSKGYFDINIDPSNAQVSFNYKIDLEMVANNIPDLMITKYAFIEDGGLELPVDIGGLTITGEQHFNNETGDAFKPFTIRVYFEWIEGTKETMDNDDDTEIGLAASEDDLTFKMNAIISFEQIIN